MVKKFALILAPILIIIGGFAAVSVLSATAPKPEQKADDTDARRYFVEPVRTQEVVLAISSQGEVRAKTQIDLASQVGGRIVALADEFVEGGSVQTGQTLINIDEADFRLALTQAESRLAQAERMLEEEKASAEIRKKQWNWDDLDDSERPTGLALREPHLAERRADVRFAQEQVNNARINLERTRLSVPFEGRVMTRNAGLGQFVSPGQSLGTVFSTDAVEVRLPLTDAQLGRLGLPLGYEADYDEARTVTFSAEVAGQTRQWQGRLVRINPSIDPRTRLVFAIAELRDPYGAGADAGIPMAVGLFVKADIEGSRSLLTYAVPREALQTNNRVFVVDGDGILDARTIDIVTANADHVYTASGLGPQDRIVLSPVRTKRPGDKIEVIEREEEARVAALVTTASAQ